jgi:hypothetical protein
MHAEKLFGFQRRGLAEKLGRFEIQHQRIFVLFQLMPVQYVHEGHVCRLYMYTGFFAGFARQGFTGKFVFFHRAANEGKPPAVFLGLAQKKQFALIFQNQANGKSKHMAGGS